jgi:hypothetical protein
LSLDLLTKAKMPSEVQRSPSINRTASPKIYPAPSDSVRKNDSAMKPHENNPPIVKKRILDRSNPNGVGGEGGEGGGGVFLRFNISCALRVSSGNGSIIRDEHIGHCAGYTAGSTISSLQ